MNVVRVVVYGPPGCGKTQHAEELSRMFGCRKVEQWDGRMHLMDHTLHLTNSLPPYGPVAEDATHCAVGRSDGRSCPVHAAQ